MNSPFRRPPNPGPSGSEPNKPVNPRDFSQLRRLYAFTKPYRWALAVAVVTTLVSSGLGLVFPKIIGDLLDTALKPGAKASDLDWVVLILVGVFFVRAIVGVISSYLLSYTGESVVSDVRRALYTHLLSLSPKFFESRKTGEITSRLTSDVSSIQSSVSNALTQLISQAFTLIGSATILFITNWRLALLMLTTVPVVVLAASFFGRRLRKLSRTVQDKIADANASAEEAITGIRVVQSFTGERLESERYGAQIRESWLTALARARVRAAFEPIIGFAMFTAISMVMWYGGRQVLEGNLKVGELISFLIYTMVIAGSIGSFTGLWTQFQEALGASSRIFELLDEKSDLLEPAQPATLESPQGRVQFESVSFRYGDRGETNILENISLEARAGEVIALVGPSGAGKSTLVSLIPRFYDVSDGKIFLDGVNIRDLELHTLRSQIGIVPQETQLFSGSILENIRYGRPEASDAEVLEAARAANAFDFVNSFPEAFGTVVGERGVKLSGGQRQRIAIARALLKNPRILILDEATSALDSESEFLVQEALERLMQHRTTFVIAHRLSTIRNADRIVVLEAGRVSELGTHSELLEAGGLYKDLYELQFRQDEAQKSTAIA
jgi:ATP-binding cassette, subfamily B, bacterial MsbA